MLIILEGVDRCGKSTLAKYLQAELRWPLYHHSKPPGRPYDLFTETMQRVRRENAILDRFYWSQLAYGPTFRDQLGMTKLEIDACERWCIERSAIVFYLEDTADAIRARWNDDEMYPHQYIEQLQAEYQRVLTETSVPYVRGTLRDWLDPAGLPTERLQRFVNALTKEVRV